MSFSSDSSSGSVLCRSSTGTEIFPSSCRWAAVAINRIRTSLRFSTSATFWHMLAMRSQWPCMYRSRAAMVRASACTISARASSTSRFSRSIERHISDRTAWQSCSTRSSAVSSWFLVRVASNGRASTEKRSFAVPPPR